MPVQPRNFAEAEVNLAATLPGYESRPQQQLLASSVEGSIAARTHLLAEAGCGCGKSLGYLIPAILSGKRVVVSTATKALQDQVACVSAETKILTADLRHVPAGEVYVGQELVGFDEQPESGENLGLRRRYRRSTVESVRRTIKPCYELEFDDGTTVTCSTDHQWLTKQSMNVKWMTADQMRPAAGKISGSCVIRLSEVWSSDASWEAGYLAGLYDGEGCLGQRRAVAAGGHYNSLTFSQRDNECYKRAAGILDDQLIEWRNHRREHEGHPEWDPINIVHISNRTNIMRVLGQFRPERLLAKFDPEMLGTIPTIRGGRPHGQRLVKKTFLGDREVVVIQTSTKTFIAEGLASHNCKDVPFLVEHLGKPFTFALLKGRSNYICFNKAQCLDAGDVPSLAKILGVVAENEANPGWHGQREDLGFEITDREWMQISADADDCQSFDCSTNLRCYSAKARARASAADLVVVNHALYLTDLMIREVTGGFSMIGAHDVVVFDECHEIEEYAGRVLGSTFKEGGVRGMCAEIRNFGRRSVPEHEEMLNAACAEVTTAMSILWSALTPGRIRQATLLETGEEFIGFANALTELVDALATKGLLTNVPTVEIERIKAKHDRLRRRVTNTCNRFIQIVTTSFEDMVRWVEMDGDKKVLKAAPVDVAPYLREHLFGKGDVTAILTSATISVGGKFEYIAGSLGIDAYDGIDVGTPFDYSKQAVLYIPTSLPDPGKERAAWTNMAMQEMYELVKVSGGRALLLFTSNKDMKDSYETLAPRLPFTCMMQGQAANKVLAERFDSDNSSVLFATRSFMTGVDFQGNTCFPAGTMVRSSKGYVAIENIQVGDRVWTHRRRYRKVTATSARAYIGDMIGVTSLGCDEVMMTPEHPVLTTKWGRGLTTGPSGKRARGRQDRSRVSLDWVAAEDLLVDHVLALPVGERNIRLPTKPLGTAWKSGHTNASKRGAVTWEDTPEFWELLGLWMAEGHVHLYTEKISETSGRGRSYREIVWSFGSHEELTVARKACDLIRYVFGNEVNPQVIGSGARVSLKHTAFGCWIERNIGQVDSRTKRLPWRLMHHPDAKSREAFLHGYHQGDGCVTKNWAAFSTTTASEQLAHQVADLAHGLGYVTTTHRRESTEANPFGAGFASWTVTWGEDQRRQSNIQGHWVARPIRSLRRINNWEGLVYNLSVEKDESYTLPGFGVHNCSLVVVNKMPFPVPTEPLTEARTDAIRSRGGSDFAEYTVPVMTLVLKQAFGRLIRHRDDTGVVAILDPRLHTKPYGRGILRSLPPAPVVTSLDGVEDFFKVTA